MATVAEGLEYAKKFNGITESPPGSNRTKIGEMYGWNGVAWCQEYVWVVLSKFDLAPYKTASTVLAANDWANRGRLVDEFEELEPGDQIFFNFSSAESNTRPNIEHTGIVLAKPEGGNVLTIEGNTSGDAGGSQSNGGGVFVRKRPKSFFVCGARPTWSGAGQPKGGKKRPREELRMGDRGHDVRFWQKCLNEWSKEEGKGKIDIEVDGEFGEKTRRATKIYQEAHGFNPDGSVDLKLLRKIEERERKDAGAGANGDKANGATAKADKGEKAEKKGEKKDKKEKQKV